MTTIDKIKIKISFQYLSGNDNLLFLIKKIADYHQITGTLSKNSDQVEIIIEDDLEKMQNFLQDLSQKLPLSIFLGEASTTEIKDKKPLKEGFKISKDLNHIPQNLSTCPTCIQELFNPNSKKFHFPFISCNYCGNQYAYMYAYPFKREKTIFKIFKTCLDCEKETQDKTSFRHKYPLNACHNCFVPIYLKKGKNEKYGFDGEKVAKALATVSKILKEKNIIKIYTPNGEKILIPPTKENIEKIQKSLKQKTLPTILIIEPKALEKIAIISTAEIKALASIEKPTVYVQSKNFLEKELFSKDIDFIKIKLPDHPLLILLAQYLKKENIDYLLIEDMQNIKEEITDFQLTVDLPIINKQEDLEIFIVQGKPVIKKGEKGLFPNIIKSTPTGNLSIAHGYAVLDLGNGEYFIDKKEHILQNIHNFVDKIHNINILENQYENLEILNISYTQKNQFKPYQGAVLSVLGEYNKIKESTVGIYLSSTFNQDCISIKTKTKPIKPVIKILPIKIYKDFYSTVKWCLSQISNSSQEGKRLIKTFLEKNPDIEKKIENRPLDKNFTEKSSITAVLNVISILLGICTDEEIDYFEKPYQQLQTQSLDFLGNQGLMIDFVLYEENNDFYLNWIKTIQSVLSYKIAGVDNRMLAFSIFEGLGDFLIKEASKISAKLNTENIALAGDFFSNPILTGRIIKHFKNKRTILINRKLPIDRQNITFGGIFI